jgi:hypothetical protein
VGAISKITYGSPTDTWGTGLTESKLISSDFGLRLRSRPRTVTGSGLFTYVDAVQITIYRERPDIPTTSQIVYYGGNTDKWGQSFTLSDINSGNFNFKLQAGISGSNTATVNNVETKVFYSYYVTGSNSQVQEYTSLGVANHRYNG